MDYNPDWVVDVKENIIWTCQLPRSGGTLLLRLLDSHPQIHCYPAVFGFNTRNRIWPKPEEISGAKDVIEDIFSYMDMTKFHGVGMKKQSSNMVQERYPIYFNRKWYIDIFQSRLKGDSHRDYFNAFFTALFNAWQNYQNLYGKKKYIAGQMTLRFPEQYRDNFINFKKVYPRGKMVFMVRKPDDWLASAIHLKYSTPFTQNPTEIMAYYKSIMKQALELSYEDALVVFKFEDLVLSPEQTLKMLCVRLQIKWNDSLLTPSFNGAPFFQNSSFELERKSNIDKTVVGRGEKLDASVLAAIDKEALGLYHKMLEQAACIENYTK